MSKFIERGVILGVAALFCFGLCRSAQFQYQEKIKAIRTANEAARQKLGLPAAQLKAKYPTPEIGMVTSGCLLPGETTDVVVHGKFSPDTKFVLESDLIEVVKESLVGNEYRATVKAAQGIGPISASLTVIAPVSGITMRQGDAVTVGGKYEFTLDAKNGWKITATSAADTKCGQTRMTDASYDMKFFKPGQAQPFETRDAKLSYDQWSISNYMFRVSETALGGDDPTAKMTELMKKLSDRSLSSAQRDKVMQELPKLQAQMQEQMKKLQAPGAMQAFAAEEEKKKREFGCGYIDLSVKAGSATGRMRCGASVGTVEVSGMMKLLGR